MLLVTTFQSYWVVCVAGDQPIGRACLVAGVHEAEAEAEEEEAAAAADISSFRAPTRAAYAEKKNPEGLCEA